MFPAISSVTVPSSVSVRQSLHRERLTPDDVEAQGLPALAEAWRAGAAGSDNAIRETYETAMAGGSSEMAEILTKRASIIDAMMRSGGEAVVAVQTSYRDGSVTQIMTAAEFEKWWVRGEGFSSNEPGRPEPSNEAKASYEAARKLPIMQMVADQLARMQVAPGEQDAAEAEGGTRDEAQGRSAVDETARKALSDVLGDGWKWTMTASGTTTDGTRVTVGIIGGVDRSTLSPELARGNSLQVIA